MTAPIEAVAPPVWRRWPGYAGVLWAAAYGMLALVWTVTGEGYPFGSADPDDELSLVGALPADVGAPLFAVVLLGFAAAVVGLVVAGRRGARIRGVPRALLLGLGWLVVAGLLVAVPGVELLIVAGYAPMLIIGAPFGWPDVEYAEVFTWPLANRALCVVGGLLLARTLLAWQFRTVGACVSCGRDERAGGWRSAAAAGVWGRAATYLAAALPLPYALTRFAWLAGIPLGVSDDFLRDLRDTGAVWAGAGLGAFAVVGAVLTLGLVQRWGEVFPRWMVGLAGRRVPVGLAVVPASLVAVFVTSAGLSLFTAGKFVEMVGVGDLAVLPMLLWPLWGAALGAATVAYYLRRRGGCGHCGRSG